MEKIICQNEEEWLTQATAWCAARLDLKPSSSLFLPAGGTPLPLYRDWVKKRPKWLEGLSILQVDEILDPPHAGRFLAFLEKELTPYRSQIRPVALPLPPGRKIAVLGLGLNGHVAFHEPGLPQDFKKGEVELSPTTCQNLGLKVGSKGFTYGVGTFMECESILVIVSGPSKKQTLEEWISGSQVFPATALLAHPDLTILILP